MFEECPHCGCKASYSFSDYGATLWYTGIFGKGRIGEECTTITHTRPAPKLAKCDECGKQIKLADLREIIVKG